MYNIEYQQVTFCKIMFICKLKIFTVLTMSVQTKKN